MRAEIQHHVSHVTAKVGPVIATGPTEGEALRVLAVLLRATASEVEAMASSASERSALSGACAAVTA